MAGDFPVKEVQMGQCLTHGSVFVESVSPAVFRPLKKPCYLPGRNVLQPGIVARGGIKRAVVYETRLLQVFDQAGIDERGKLGHALKASADDLPARFHDEIQHLRFARGVIGTLDKNKACLAEPRRFIEFLVRGGKTG